MSRGRRAWVINGVLLVALLGVAWGGYALFFASSSSSSTPAVRTSAVRTGTVTETVTAAGTVSSAYTGTADFTGSGTITEIDVKVGDTVTKGQRLAALDDSTAKLQLASAKADLNSASQSLADTKAKAGVTSTQIAQSQAQVAKAQVSVKQAQLTVDQLVLTAPGNGTVTAVNGQVGSRPSSAASSASSSTATATSSGFIQITDLANLTVKAQVAEIDVARLKAGQQATVTVNALKSEPIQATVGAVDLTPTTANSVVQYGVTLNLTGAPAGLRPGQSASVQVTVAQAQDALTVPAAAVTTTGGTSTVSVLSNGQQATRQVTVGVRGDSTVQVTSGLSAGDEVVLPSVTTGSRTGTGTGTGQLGGLPGGTGGGVRPGGTGSGR
jgi:macrolide-specific efflux system membrane fusion protein